MLVMLEIAFRPGSTLARRRQARSFPRPDSSSLPNTLQREKTAGDTALCQSAITSHHQHLHHPLLRARGPSPATHCQDTTKSSNSLLLGILLC
jgi:hypothetical protein